MSNGDDVLDNWEEIDEAGLSNKLNKIQAERKTLAKQQQELQQEIKTSAASSSTSINNSTSFQPMKLLQRTPSQDTTVSSVNSSATSNSSALKSPLDDMSASFQPVMMVLHQPVDEYQSANYTQPISSQTVKILRRPTQSSELRNNGMRPRQPIKSLKQREQEYAEARLRILGSAKNPEDDEAASSTPPSNNTSLTSTAAVAAKVNSSPKTPATQNSYNNHYQQQQPPPPAKAYNNSNISMNVNYNNQRTPIASPHQQQLQQMQQLQQQQQQTWSPIVGSNLPSSTLRQQESILRMPRGPEGSAGFQLRR